VAAAVVVLRLRLLGGRRGWGFTRRRLPGVLLDAVVEIRAVIRRRREKKTKKKGG
jgi:hypothetical protein